MTTLGNARGLQRPLTRKRAQGEPLQRKGCAFRFYEPREVLGTSPLEELQELLALLPLDSALRRHADVALSKMGATKIRSATALARQATRHLTSLSQALDLPNRRKR